MKKGFTISAVITALQFIAAALVFFYLPEQIPIHWNIAGVVDQFGGKAFIFLPPVMSLGVILLMYWLPRMVRQRENIERSGRIYPLMMILTSFMMSVLLMVTAATALGYQVPVFQIVPGFIGILLITAGNYFPKVKMNYIMGIRLPWTLASETVWTKTHRLGGWVFSGSGLLFIVGIFLPVPANFIVPLAGLLVGLLIVCVYAFRLHRQTL